MKASVTAWRPYKLDRRGRRKRAAACACGVTTQRPAEEGWRYRRTTGWGGTSPLFEVRCHACWEKADVLHA